MRWRSRHSECDRRLAIDISNRSACTFRTNIVIIVIKFFLVFGSVFTSTHLQLCNHNESELCEAINNKIRLVFCLASITSANETWRNISNCLLIERAIVWTLSKWASKDRQIPYKWPVSSKLVIPWGVSSRDHGNGHLRYRLLETFDEMKFSYSTKHRTILHAEMPGKQ